VSGWLLQGDRRRGGHDLGPAGLRALVHPFCPPHPGSGLTGLGRGGWEQVYPVVGRVGDEQTADRP
jgi:hypothetical protein